MLVVAIAAPPVAAQIAPGDLQDAIEKVRGVAPGGAGHEQAVSAIAVLNQASARQVPDLLQGMDGANPLAVNWLRGAIQSALDGTDDLPRADIRAYLDDHTRSSMGRLTAFELLVDDDPELSDSLLPKMIDDPSLPLRQKAVAWLMNQADEAAGENGDADNAGSARYLIAALASARDVDQMQQIALKLEDHNVPVDMQKMLGVVNSWHVVGGFDNRDEKGFDTPHGPELDLTSIDTTASYDDTPDGQPVSWVRHNTVSPSGMVDLNELLGKQKGTTAYAYAEFEAAEDTDCEIRIGCINANKVWLNGTEIINNEIYHVGMMTDQFTGAGELKKGTNTILFKVCQNEQEQPWAQDWMFQLRICTADGAAIKAAPPARRGEGGE